MRAWPTSLGPFDRLRRMAPTASRPAKRGLRRAELGTGAVDQAAPERVPDLAREAVLPKIHDDAQG